MCDLHDSSRRDLATSHRTPGLRKLFPIHFWPVKRNSCLEEVSIGIPLGVSSLGTMILACEPFLSFSDGNCAEAVQRLLTDTMSGAETFHVSQVMMCRPRVHASFGFFKNTDLRDCPDVVISHRNSALKQACFQSIRPAGEARLP